MSDVSRPRLAAPVVAVYWFVLLVGLGVYTADRMGDAHATLGPLWIGAVVGTALGQFLALRDLRLWLAALIIAAATYFTMPMAAIAFGVFSTWKAFIPAALCGFWSLGDRSALVAFWFPTVVWMLSILDRTAGNANGGALAPDASGLGLLGVLAIGLFLFLRARESRRVALWRAVSAQPLAEASAPTLLKRAPGHAVARASWTLTVTAISAAITAWLAPHLWQLEPLRGVHVAVPDLTTLSPANQLAAEEAWHLPCCPRVNHLVIERARIRDYFDLGRGQDGAATPIDEPPDVCRTCDQLAVADGAGDIAVGGVTSAGTGDAAETAPVGAAREVAHEEEPTWHAIPAEPVAAVAPPIEAQHAPVDPTLFSARPEMAEPRVPVAPPRVAPPPVTPPVVALDPPPARPARSEPPPRDAPLADVHAPPPIARHPVTWWPWLLTLAAGALVFQTVVLGLRPLRRLVILRHLRRPFWDETIDQRVSNAWQLALIGLHDAGWRPDTGEAPRELAARVGVAGIAACAVILERARHGLGIDAGDLAEIQRQADVAYDSARAPLGAIPRAVGWLRWPLT